MQSYDYVTWFMRANTNQWPLNPNYLNWWKHIFIIIKCKDKLGLQLLGDKFTRAVVSLFVRAQWLSVLNAASTSIGNSTGYGKKRRRSALIRSNCIIQFYVLATQQLRNMYVLISIWPKEYSKWIGLKVVRVRCILSSFLMYRSMATWH